MMTATNGGSCKSLFHFLLPLRSFGNASSSSNNNNSTLRVSILHYDASKHRFAPALCFFQEKHDNGRGHESTAQIASPRHNMMSLYAFQKEFGTKSFPSAAWTNIYTEWRNWTCASHSNDSNDKDDGSSGYNSGDSASRYLQQHQAAPAFHSVEELQAFNQKGRELVKRLRHELQTIKQNTCKVNVEVEDYIPILSSIQVGESWWHVRDCHYGFVVPIQSLPVSTDLKSRLQAWRFHKGECLLRTEHQIGELRQECRELEESIVLELNAPSDGELISRTLDNPHFYRDVFPPQYTNGSTAADASMDKSYDVCAWQDKNASSSLMTSNDFS